MVVVAGGRPGDAAQVERRPRVTIIYGRELFGLALAALLSAPPIEAEVRLLSDPVDADQLLEERPPDIVVCDARSHRLTGEQLVRDYRAQGAETAVILVADAGDEPLLLAGLPGSAAGFFANDMPVNDFVFGVQAVLAGHRALSRTVMESLVAAAGTERREQRDPFERLSPTELEILTLVTSAKSIPAIAAARHISSKTVRNHLASIYRKLEVKGRTEAILYAARFGIGEWQTCSDTA